MASLKDKRVLVVGGSSGIGQAVAAQALAAGAAVTIASRSQAKLQKAADALGGGVTHSLALDAHGKCLSSAILTMSIDWFDQPFSQESLP